MEAEADADVDRGTEDAEPKPARERDSVALLLVEDSLSSALRVSRLLEVLLDNVALRGLGMNLHEMDVVIVDEVPDQLHTAKQPGRRATGDGARGFGCCTEKTKVLISDVSTVPLARPPLPALNDRGQRIVRETIRAQEVEGWVFVVRDRGTAMQKRKWKWKRRLMWFGVLRRRS